VLGANTLATPSPTDTTGPPSGPTRRERLILLLGWLAVLLLVGALTWRDYDAFQFGAYQDDARYLLLGRSLTSASEYSLATGPGPVLRTSYPFLFPAVLAVLSHFAPGNFAAGKIVAALATLVSISLLFWGWPVLAPGSSRRWGLVVAALFGLSPLVLAHARVVMSDALFTALALSALLLVEKVVAGRRSFSWLLALGVASACAFSCRLIGLALLLAVVARCALARPSLSPRGWAAFAIGVLAVVAVPLVSTSYAPRNFLPTKALSTLRRPSERGFDARNDRLLYRVFFGVREYGGQLFREALVPLGGGEGEARLAQRLGVPGLPALLSALVTAVLLVGAAQRRRGWRLCSSALLFEAAFIAVLMLWIFRMPRFLIPILPFLLFQLLGGLGWLAQGAVAMLGGDRAGRVSAFRAAAAGAALVLLPISVAKATRRAENSRYCVRDFEVEAGWLRDHTTPTSLVVARDSIALHLYARRPTIEAKFFPSAPELERAVVAYGIDYIVVAPEADWRHDGGRRYDPLMRDVVLPFSERLVREGRAELVFASPPADLLRIYRLRH